MTKKCLTGKHKFDIDARCIHCGKTKVELQDQWDWEFLQHLFNSNPRIEDKRSILRSMGYPVKKWEGFITELEDKKK